MSMMMMMIVMGFCLYDGDGDGDDNNESALFDGDGGNKADDVHDDGDSDVALFALSRSRWTCREHLAFATYSKPRRGCWNFIMT